MYGYYEVSIPYQSGQLNKESLYKYKSGSGTSAANGVSIPYQSGQLNKEKWGADSFYDC
jgi:hypothetical protein